RRRAGLLGRSNFVVRRNYLFAEVAPFRESAATLGPFSAFGFSAPPDNRHFARRGTWIYVFASDLAFMAGPPVPHPVPFPHRFHGLQLADGTLSADVCSHAHVRESSYRGFSWLVAGRRESDYQRRHRRGLCSCGCIPCGPRDGALRTENLNQKLEGYIVETST